MPFVTLAGYELPCRPESTRSLPDREGGFRGESFTGALRDTTRYQKRGWSLDVTWTTNSVFLAVRAAVANGATVSLNGDIVNNSPVTVRASIGDAQFRYFNGALYRSFDVTVLEV